MLAEMPEREAGIERPAAKSRFFFAKSWDFISADPLGYTRLLLRKFYLFWHGNEILRNLDPYYARNDSLILRILLWKYGLAFPFGLVASLAVPGLVLFLFLERRHDGSGALKYFCSGGITHGRLVSLPTGSRGTRFFAKAGCLCQLSVSMGGRHTQSTVQGCISGENHEVPGSQGAKLPGAQASGYDPEGDGHVDRRRVGICRVLKGERHPLDSWR